MCDPITILTAASAVTSYISAEDQAAGQQRAINQAHQVEQNQLQQQRIQNDQQASERMSEAALESLRETGRLSALTGDSLLTGNTNDRITAEHKMQTGQNIAAMEANRLNAQGQINAESMAASMRRDQQLSQVKGGSLIGTGLQIAGAYYTQKEKQEAKRTPQIKTSTG